MLFQFVGKLDPCIFLSALRESSFLSVFITYQIIDNVIVIESFVFNQSQADGAQNLTLRGGPNILHYITGKYIDRKHYSGAKAIESCHERGGGRTL
ncbi:UNVERIFIED_CONTAM: hypothetical protein NCL1_44532 [Trichonephila clavipes]